MDPRRRARISAALVTLLVLGSPALASCTLPTAKPRSPTPNQGPAQLPSGGKTVMVPGAYRPHTPAAPTTGRG